MSVQENIKDVGLWKVIINGYPYKSIQELGVANREEAFTATKQAVYCYIHGNRLEDYEPIGEAGTRTLNAMYTIINNANNSQETKVSSSLTVQSVGNQWVVDNKEKQYISKEFKVIANSRYSKL